MSKDQSPSIPFDKGYRLLVDDGLKPRPQPRPNPKTLPLSQIKFATSVFQPRTKGGNIADSRGHVSVLANAVRTSVNHLLDPVLIWWSGKCWLVIDGHHRLIAYKQVTTDAKRPVMIDAVPVEVFEGTLHEAIHEAVRRNAKDKLPMTKVDKLERAWKLTGLGGMSRSEIAKLTCIAEGTVSAMRKRMSEMKSTHEAGPREFDGSPPRFDPLSTTWEEAKTGRVNEYPGGPEAWATKQATDMAAGLGQKFGKKLADKPSILAQALSVYCDRLPAALYEALREFISEDQLIELDEVEADEAGLAPAL